MGCVKYLSPKEGMTATTTFPADSGLAHTLVAAETMAPLDTPTERCAFPIYYDEREGIVSYVSTYCLQSQSIKGKRS